ncbi:putative COPII coat assembly protein, Sec16 [Helianthus debilis subsp. tardiflorus]
MASNPPFMVEDTDEDFFDKLVDDDDDDDLNPPALALKEEIDNIVDDNDSDDAKAFADLSISDVGAGVEDLGEVGLEEDSLLITKEEFSNVTRVDSSRIVSSNSLTVDNNVNDEPDNGAIQLDKPVGSTGSEDQNQGSGGTAGVKEVQWSSFGSDSVENSDNVFGADPGFFNEFDNGSVDQIGKEDSFISSVVNNSLQVEDVNTYSHQLQSNQAYATTGEQASDGQDPNSIQYWENLYPGWKYDANTGQWYQVDGNYDATSYAEGVSNTESASDWNLDHQNSEVSHLQQSAQSVVGAVAEKGTTESITSWDSVSQSGQSLSNWNQGSEANNKVYPPHMVFDPQYPGWYYDMHVQEWRSLDEYNSQSTAVAQELVNQNGYGSSNTYYENEQKAYSGQEQAYNWNGSFSNAGQQSSTMWQPSNVATSAPMEEFRNDQPIVSGTQSAVPYSQSFSQPLEQSEPMNVQKAYGNQNQLSYLQQTVQSAHQVSYGSTTGRSSAGHPPHALVTFGFGGKLIVMKDSTTLINASYGGQDSKSGSISVLNLAEVVTGGGNVHDYFRNLCQQPYPGPLSGGNAGSKELNKWIDDTITHTETSDVVYNKGGVLRLLLSLLKIALQHYGKLRSPLGSDTSLKENEAPEVAVARLFASVKSSAEYHNYGAFAHCLQHVPSEAQTREAAAEVQTLLVSGRKKEALLRAQEGQLWGPALVLAAQLGDLFYVDTVKKMALGQLVPGSPLRTLCLLIAGQPADVFATDATTDGGVPGALNMFQQHPTQGQLSVNGMLDDWEDNLAVITANRTKDDELVLTHLGDCLWKERSNIIAAHICYLVAEANFEAYSDSARLCLIGADHWTHPRTYASPEAIQRTEVYEYSKMLGNSQFTLLPFQPYKLIYAHMLAEVGRVSDSLKYCQAVTKSLKTGRIPEVEIWRQLVISLEDRIKTHQQGGFTTGKIVGKLLNLFDSTAHRVVGGLPPPVPSTSGGSAQHDYYQQPQKGSRVLTSQSTMAMSSLVPSASMDPINQADGNNRNMMHNRSASEPVFGRSPSPVKDDTLKENSAVSADSKSKASEKPSGRRGFSFRAMLYEKTVGRILPARQDKQAKLGDANKFYYDEKLKRWVEEGVDPPAEEAALAPPPTMTTAFQNGSPDYSLKSALTPETVSSEFASPAPATHTSGIPLIPPTTNQFSARARTGVRARYVDTFNKGGGNQTNLFQSPSVPNTKRPNPNPNFFVPTAAPAPADNPPDNHQTPPLVSSTTSQSSMQKFASMNDMSKGGSSSSLTSTSSVTNHPMSRRTSSWSGSVNQDFPVPGSNSEQQHMFMPTKPSFAHSSSDDLQEVEL